MSEPKRVPFTTISTTAATTSFGIVGNNAGTSSINAAATVADIASNSGVNSMQFPRFGSDLFTQDKNDATTKNPKAEKKTIRLEMKLFPSDNYKYPEFNYARLVFLEKKKQKKIKEKANGLNRDPLAVKDDDDEVARIAKELEKKYGSAYSSKRGSAKRDDQCDIGLGYDDNDSFIDNTEAYDEVIPEEVETIEGGFYINCGPLQFKNLHTENSHKTRTDEIIKMPDRPRKRVLSTTSEDSSGEEDDDSSSTTNNNNNKKPTTNKIHKSSSTSGKTKSSSDSGGNKKNDKQTTTAQTSSGGLSFSSSNSPKPMSGGGASDSDSAERIRQKAVKTTTVKDMLKAKRDNFLKMQVGTDTKTFNGEVKGTAGNGGTSEDDEEDEDDDDDDDEDDDDKTTTDDETGESGSESDTDQSVTNEKKTKEKPLPQGQAQSTADVESTMVTLVQTNLDTNPTGIGSNEVPLSEESKEKLRKVDTKLPELNTEVLTNIHGFKDLLKTRNISGKKLIFDDKMAETFLKIDDALCTYDASQKNMVFAHLEFHLQLPKYFFLRKAKQLRMKEEKMKSTRALEKLRKAVIETMPTIIANYESEIHKYTEMQSSNMNTDQPLKLPRKKFPWNNIFRNLLYDVYHARWTSYAILATRKETLEDFVNVYMKTKVVEIWPNGWMRYDELSKEIEKRKNAMKKAKEKKDANPSLTTNLLPSKQQQQQDDYTGSRSCANSDTDSVASSNTSGSVKRKKSDASSKSSNRNKAQKLMQLKEDITLQSIPPPPLPPPTQAVTITTCSGTGAPIPIDLKNCNTGAISISTSNAVNMPTTLSATAYTTTQHSTFSSTSISTASSSSSLSSTVQQQQQQLYQKHSNPMVAAAPTAHVIDLDKFTSANDILQTTKQMINAAVNAETNLKPSAFAGKIIPPITTGNYSTTIRHDSDSDGVEIVGVFPASKMLEPTKLTKKQKKNAIGNINNAGLGGLPPNFNLGTQGNMYNAGGGVSISQVHAPPIPTVANKYGNNRDFLEVINRNQNSNPSGKVNKTNQQQ